MRSKVDSSHNHSSTSTDHYLAGLTGQHLDGCVVTDAVNSGRVVVQFGDAIDPMFAGRHALESKPATTVRFNVVRIRNLGTARSRFLRLNP